MCSASQLRVPVKRIWMALIAATAAAGCGGDGGGGDITDPPPSSFTVGGTVSGLAGVGCVLQNSGGDDFALSGNGVFTFPTSLAAGSAYSATVFRQPVGPTQTCTINNGNGTVSDANVTNIEVSCSVDKPVCNSSPEDLGSVSGDLEVHNVSTSGVGEAWARVRITETSNASVYVSAAVVLEVPPGVDYDLTVFCLSCVGRSAGQSVAGPGEDEQVLVRWEDRPGPDDSADIRIHVSYSSGSSAENWTLRVRGNQPTQATTCSL